MVTEDYVSFETAKLLEEKGFVGDYTRRYSLIDESDWQGDNRVELSVGDIYSSEIIYIKESIPCPTLQMAMKWLREVHNISIEVVYDCSNDKPKTISWWLAYIKHINSDSSKGSDCLTAYDSYEEAADDAIKYVLENWI